MPQGSILRAILFNIFLSDLFLIVGDANFASYADGNEICKACDNFDDVITYLQPSSKELCKWLLDNQMKGNTDKHHLIISCNDSSNILMGN